MIPKRKRFWSASVLALILGSLAFVGSSSLMRPADASNGGMDVMSIDTNASGNSADTVGTVDQCAQIQKDGVQNYDEDFIDGVIIDVTAQGISAYNDNGTPSDPSDDTGGLVGYQYTLTYPSKFTVAYADAASASKDPTVNILAANDTTPATSIFNASEPLPDDETVNYNTWQSVVADAGTSGGPDGAPESGDGVLDRLKITVEESPSAGQYLVQLTNNGHSDAANGFYQPNTTGFANIAV